MIVPTVGAVCEQPVSWPYVAGIVASLAFGAICACLVSLLIRRSTTVTTTVGSTRRIRIDCG